MKKSSSVNAYDGSLEKYVGTDDSFARLARNMRHRKHLRSFIFATTTSTCAFLHRTGVVHAQTMSRPTAESSTVLTETKAPSKKKALVPVLVLGTVAIGRCNIIFRKKKEGKDGYGAFNDIIGAGKPLSQSQTLVRDQNPSKQRSAKVDTLLNKSKEITMRAAQLANELDSKTLSHEESLAMRGNNTGVENSIVEDVSTHKNLGEAPGSSQTESEDITVDQEVVNFPMAEERLDTTLEEPVPAQSNGEDHYLNPENTENDDLNELNYINGTTVTQETTEEMNLNEIQDSDNEEDDAGEELSEEELAKKYADIEDLGERAFEILKDLGMIEITPDPDEKAFQ